MIGEARDVLERYRKIPTAGFIRDYLKLVTTFHRIQGSKDLERAIKLTAEIAEDLGLNVKVYQVPSGSLKGYMETPVSWNVQNAYVEFKKDDTLISRYEHADHPTLVSAHSPPGEGCSELKVCSNIENCRGGAVLLESPAFIAYHEVDADLVVLYDSKRYPEAVPYTGLFLRRDEVKPKPTIVNIPYVLAQRLISFVNRGLGISVCWRVVAEFSDTSLPALIAYNGDEPGVLFISHICHPKPGAHDNASGSAANLAVAKILSQAKPTYPHAHAFVPEYTGTIYIREHLPWMPKYTINLDMVGSKQGVTGSVLNIVNPPLFMKPIVAAYTFIATKLVLDEASSFGGFSLPAYRYSITPYTAGSDHDVTLVWGLDSVMLNEWPSKFYHTDMDDVDTLSTSHLSSTSVLASLAGYLAYTSFLGERVLEYYRGYLKSWYAFEALKKNLDASGISRLLEYWGTRPEIRGPETPISARTIYKWVGRQLYLKLREIRGALAYLSVYAPLAYMSGLENYEELYLAENALIWSKEERKVINEVWSVVKDKLR